jgi:hypothetical protein
VRSVTTQLTSHRSTNGQVAAGSRSAHAHSAYKRGAGGSNPPAPTEKPRPACRSTFVGETVKILRSSSDANQMRNARTAIMPIHTGPIPPGRPAPYPDIITAISFRARPSRASGPNIGSNAHKRQCHQSSVAAPWCGTASRRHDDAGLCLAVQDFLDGVVDRGQWPGLVDDLGLPGGVQREHVQQVGASADDRPDH